MTIHLSVFLLTLNPRFKLSESRIDRHRSDMLYIETGNTLLDLPGQVPVLHIRGDPSVPELLLILRRLPFRPTGKRVTPSELTVAVSVCHSACLRENCLHFATSFHPARREPNMFVSENFGEGESGQADEEDEQREHLLGIIR